MGRQEKQAGLVSIMVTMILMVVITLVVLGFAQISRRNQRNALDQQLSTQAFYAAETGVNDAANALKQAIATGVTVSAKTDCGAGTGPVYGTLPSSVLDSGTNVSYTCLMVDPTPSSLQYSKIKTDRSTIIPLSPASGTFANIKLTWKSTLATSTPATGCSASVAATGNLPTTSNWTCGYGILRFDLVPTSGTLSLSSLQTFMTSFLVPTTAATGGTIAYATGSNIINRSAVTCDHTNCSITITGLSGSSYYMRASSLYQEAGQFTITATDSSGNALKFQNAQALIDATGRAQDVLRRVQVRMPLTASTTTNLPDNALSSTDAVCKRFRVMDGYFASDAAAAVGGLTSLTGAANKLCS